MIEDNICINIHNLTKIYKIYEKPADRVKEALDLRRRRFSIDFYALKNVSLKVARGEIYGIMGKNGSGKSTLLKIITGVLTANSGEVSTQGKIAALLELGAGFNNEYTGLENIYLNAMMIGFSKEEITKKLDDIISFADIGDYLNQPVKMYSSGMFARLAFSVSINVDPDILIVDEALSVGDYFFQAKCYKKFEDFKNRGKTILFVSHDMSSILKYCDKVLLLENGKRTAEGTAKEIVDLYKKSMSAGICYDNITTESKGTEDSTIVYKDFLNINPNHVDYGNGDAFIVDFAIKNQAGSVTNSLTKNDLFTIWFKVFFQKVIEMPIFAFTVRDSKGTDLIGTNTLLENCSLKLSEAGANYECSFSQMMLLQGGDYLLSLGCTGYNGDTIVVYHRLYDICAFTVVSDKNTIGIYDCNSEIEIRKC
jgi:teichoic acid transport system ATP-binding protein